MFKEKVLNQVIKTINKYKMFSRGDKVCVGLSGGADSVCLLYCLYLLKEMLGIEIIAAHVNHGIRGEAGEDAKYCKKLCEELGVEFYLKEVKIKEISKALRIGEEEAGRKVRYSFFNEVCSGGKIATAHNRNDNVETVIMRLVRGTGLNGLCGIKHVNGNIVRPILDVDRSDIEGFVKECGLEHVTDRTNFEEVYTRNKIRLRVIPYIKENINPSVVESINANISGYNDDADYLNQMAAKAFDEHVSEEDGIYRIKAQELSKEHIAIQKRVIINVFGKLGEDEDGLSSDNVNTIIGLIGKESGKMFSLRDKCFVVSGDDLIAFNKQTSSRYDYSFEKVVEKEIVNNGYVCYIPVSDANNIQIRTRKNGDIVRIDECTHKKLNDLFREKNVPKELRDSIEVICVNDEIVMVPGFFGTRYRERDGEFLKIIAVKRSKSHEEG